MKKLALGLMSVLTALTLTAGIYSDKGNNESVSPVIMMMEHGDHGG
jgi:hypothetical protein